MNKKDFTKTIQRILTAVFFWGVFTLYSFIRGYDIEITETVILFTITGVVSPFFISQVYKSLK